MPEDNQNQIEKYQQIIKSLELIKTMPERRAIKRTIRDPQTFQGFVPAEIPLLQDFIKTLKAPSSTEKNTKVTAIGPKLLKIQTDSDLIDCLKNLEITDNTSPILLRTLVREITFSPLKSSNAIEIYSYINDIPPDLFDQQFNSLSTSILTELKEHYINQKEINLRDIHNNINKRLQTLDQAGQHKLYIDITRQRRIKRELNKENDPQGFKIAAIMISIGVVLLLWRIFIY